MKKDPFAALSGLDQQLFQASSRTPTTKQRNNETTLSRNNVPTVDRLNETTLSRDNDATEQRSNETTEQRLNEATRPRTASLRGQVAVRLTERHSHDVYRDQVRWLNRVKLEIEERYGRRVTVNGLVKLALDLLREDYETNKARSNVIRALIRGEPVTAPVSGDGG